MTGKGYLRKVSKGERRRGGGGPGGGGKGSLRRRDRESRFSWERRAGVCKGNERQEERPEAKEGSVT